MADVFSVAVPEPVTEVGVIVALRPAEPVAVKVTVPPNWFTAVTVTVEVVGVPARIVTPTGAAMVKSALGVGVAGELVGIDEEYAYQPTATAIMMRTKATR